MSRGGRICIVLAVALAQAWVGLGATQGGVFSLDEALTAAFPGASIESEWLFLTSEQTDRVSALAGGDAPSALVARYVARRDGRVVGRAYVETHVVRTKRESLLVSLDSSGRVQRIDVTAFLEPPEYRASERWLRQYEERLLDDELALQRGIRPLAGATLTAVATNAAVRRVLAIDRVLTTPGQVVR